MRPADPGFNVVLLITAVFLLGSPIAAQTLERRPPAQSEPPPSTTAPPNAKTANAKAASANPPLADDSFVLPQGTNLQVQIARHYPMKAGETIEGRLLYPIYADDKVAIAQNTLLRGTVVALKPDTSTRWQGRLRGDFTPFHTALVQFNELMLPGGEVAIATTGAVSGAPVLHLSTPGVTPPQSFFARYWAKAKGQLHDRVTDVTAPGMGDRALQMLYHQLPYHPQRIEASTTWSIDLAAPLALPDPPTSDPIPVPAVLSTRAKPETFSVNALLSADLTSATAKPGDSVRALVVEPVFDKSRQLVIPQGSVLLGKVTASKAARSLGRNGKLRFTFQQVRFPEGQGSPSPGQPIQGSLAGANPESQQGLSLDAEGTISPHNQGSVIAPLLLTVLAGRALDEDGNLTAQTGVASNGFGLVGRIVGLAAGNRDLAAGIGYYAAALSVYEHFLRPGSNVDFPKNTRIEIETTPMHSPPLTPNAP